jgi:uncharacterized protein with HEPN domain
VKDDRLYLLHINECLNRIARYVVDGEDAFYGDLKTQDAVLRNLQTLAESTQRLSQPLRSAHQEIDWRGIAGFRNILVHDYLGINVKRVWRVVADDFPALKQLVDRLLSDVG